MSGSPRNSRSIRLFFPQRVLSSLLAPDQNEVIVQRMSDSVHFSTSSTFHRSFPPDESAMCATHASTKYVARKSTNYEDENWGQLRNIGEAEIRRALAVTIRLNVPRCRRKVKLIDHTSGMTLQAVTFRLLLIERPYHTRKTRPYIRLHLWTSSFSGMHITRLGGHGAGARLAGLNLVCD